MPPTNTLISLIFLWIFNLFWYNSYYVFMYLCIYVFMYLCIYVFMYLILLLTFLSDYCIFFIFS
ncbi:hypothetical protein EC568_04385 [Helicobacter pylori]|nr:hypothetical protein EC568_04385 [Helicobacter pylori]